MSTTEQARKLVEQAERSIQGGNPQVAIEELRQAILYSPKSADAYILLGIALAQTRLAADAENAFRKAILLAPNSVKAIYNLAVHQFAQGEFRNALLSAREAATLDPTHVGSRNLVAQIEAQLGLEEGGMPATTAAGNPAPVALREGYEPLDARVMPIVERLGPAWMVIGWGIAGLSLIGLVLMIQIARPYIGMNIQSDALVRAMSEGSLAQIVRAIHFASVVLGVIWTGMDAIHRKGNLLWLLPQVACGCLGFTWLIVPIYIFVGRQN